MTHTARYAVTFGLSGCYMPDSHLGAYEFTRRRDLVAFLRDVLRDYDMPASALRSVRVRRLWSFIARNGSSVAHFSVTHGAHKLAFHGLTEAEYREANAD